MFQDQANDSAITSDQNDIALEQSAVKSQKAVTSNMATELHDTRETHSAQRSTTEYQKLGSLRSADIGANNTCDGLNYGSEQTRVQSVASTHFAKNQTLNIQHQNNIRIHSKNRNQIKASLGSYGSTFKSNTLHSVHKKALKQIRDYRRNTNTYTSSCQYLFNQT